MKAALLLCVVSFSFCAFLESADIGNFPIPVDITVNGKQVPAAKYAIRIESNAIELVKGDEVIANEPAIILPAAGPDETTITVMKSKKQDYVRIRVRFDKTWYIVYLPATQHPVVSTQHP
jgi:hypothetical protein